LIDKRKKLEKIHIKKILLWRKKNILIGTHLEKVDENKIKQGQDTIQRRLLVGAEGVPQILKSENQIYLIIKKYKIKNTQMGFNRRLFNLINKIQSKENYLDFFVNCYFEPIEAYGKEGLIKKIGVEHRADLNRIEKALNDYDFKIAVEPENFKEEINRSYYIHLNGILSEYEKKQGGGCVAYGGKSATEIKNIRKEWREAWEITTEKKRPGQLKSGQTRKVRYDDEHGKFKSMKERIEHLKNHLQDEDNFMFFILGHQ